jgi:hypothetical protein
MSSSSIRAKVRKWFVRSMSTGTDCEWETTELRRCVFDVMERFRKSGDDLNQVFDAIVEIMRDDETCFCQQETCERFWPHLRKAFENAKVGTCAGLFYNTMRRTLKEACPWLARDDAERLTWYLESDRGGDVLFKGFRRETKARKRRRTEEAEDDEEEEGDGGFVCLCGKECESMIAAAFKQSFSRSGFRSCREFWDATKGWVAKEPTEEEVEMGMPYGSEFEAQLSAIRPTLKTHHVRTLSVAISDHKDDPVCICGRACM